MKQTMKPNMIRGVLRRTKEKKNETGGKQPDGDACPFLRPAMVAVVTMMSCGDGGSSEHVTGGS